MLAVALDEARAGLSEGGIPIGAAPFDAQGTLLGRGHNRRVQDGDPSAYAETDAFWRAGRQRHYRDKIMVTTLAPCSGLIRQFGILRVVVGEASTIRRGMDWLRANGVAVVNLQSEECIRLLGEYITRASDRAGWRGCRGARCVDLP